MSGGVDNNPMVRYDGCMDEERQASHKPGDSSPTTKTAKPAPPPEPRPFPREQAAAEMAPRGSRRESTLKTAYMTETEGAAPNPYPAPLAGGAARSFQPLCWD